MGSSGYEARFKGLLGYLQAFLWYTILILFLGSVALYVINESLSAFAYILITSGIVYLCFTLVRSTCNELIMFPRSLSAVVTIEITVAPLSQYLSLHSEPGSRLNTRKTL